MYMDKTLEKASKILSQITKQIGLPRPDSLIYSSSDFFLYLIEELSDHSAGLLWRIMARIEKGDTPDCIYELTKHEILEELGMNSDKDHTRLRKVFRELTACNVVIDDNKSTDFVNLFEKVSVKKHSPLVTFKFHKDLDRFLFNVVGTQIRAVLKYTQKLSKRAAKLYFLLVSQFKTQDRTVEVSFLRPYLGIKENEYQRFYDFNIWVLKPILKEINDYADINIKAESIKKGRSIVEIYFTFTEKYPESSPRIKPTYALLENPMDIDEFIQEELGFDSVQTRELLERHSEELIRGGYEIGIQRMKPDNRSRKGSRGGYFIKSIDSFINQFVKKKDEEEKKSKFLEQKQEKKQEAKQKKQQQNIEKKVTTDQRKLKVQLFLHDNDELETKVKGEFISANTNQFGIGRLLKNRDAIDWDSPQIRESFNGFVFKHYLENSSIVKASAVEQTELIL
jgi:hypothetical protein